MYDGSMLSIRQLVLASLFSGDSRPPNRPDPRTKSNWPELLSTKPPTQMSGPGRTREVSTDSCNSLTRNVSVTAAPKHSLCTASLGPRAVKGRVQRQGLGDEKTLRRPSLLHLPAAKWCDEKSLGATMNAALGKVGGRWLSLCPTSHVDITSI